MVVEAINFWLVRHTPGGPKKLLKSLGQTVAVAISAFAIIWVVNFSVRAPHLQHQRLQADLTNVQSARDTALNNNQILQERVQTLDDTEKKLQGQLVEAQSQLTGARITALEAGRGSVGPQWNREKLEVLSNFAERGQELKTAPRPTATADTVQTWRKRFLGWFDETSAFIKKECTTQALLVFLDTSDYLTRTFNQVHPAIQKEINLAIASTSNLVELLGRPETCP